ncbi:unnamed protein product [Linum trigynum]|uniref:Uncharacterized protein n=1 Tax=Linum trigynum TaxID=586398 RepID=A0AAV2GMW0_9ROSI
MKSKTFKASTTSLTTCNADILLPSPLVYSSRSCRLHVVVGEAFEGEDDRRWMLRSPLDLMKRSRSCSRGDAM